MSETPAEYTVQVSNDPFLAAVAILMSIAEFSPAYNAYDEHKALKVLLQATLTELAAARERLAQMTAVLERATAFIAEYAVFHRRDCAIYDLEHGKQSCDCGRADAVAILAAAKGATK